MKSDRKSKKSFLEKNKIANLLKERTKFLAKELDHKDKESGQLKIIEFSLANERYGVESPYIIKTVNLDEVTPLPCTPDFIVGIINEHGKIFTIINIKKIFNIPDNTEEHKSKAILLRKGKMEFGILIDEIIGEGIIPLNLIQESPSTLSITCGEYLKGITPQQLAILDVEKFLDDKRIIVDEEA